MTGILTVEQLRENVAQSRRHIAKQETLVAHLLVQGHDSMAVEARRLLATMHEHLQLEIEMLARMEARLAGS